MQKVLFVLLMIVLGVALVMCSGEKKEETTQEATQEMQQTAVSDTGTATCPGCGMEMDKAQMVAHDVDGETEYFCSAECKTNYLAVKEKEGETEEETPTEEM
jgi:YHS domain-containing protein